MLSVTLSTAHAQRCRQSREVRLLDLGTADAGTSLALVRDIIARPGGRARHANRGDLRDQPGNDWASVFARTQGTVPTEGLGPAAAPTLTIIHVLASG